jgi:hypothetical protein
MDKECVNFEYDSDWYYCALQDKNIDPNECKKCNKKVAK